ncbi:dTDP-4-dehydrorhamnose reductase [Aureivirga sp. CE67]|uniref:dTDP-4-dehydrorhamnose reductase n=1 Tax=Aureivirga sp. CE67 TaxID=1788983 RepID=UPI0018CA9D39|nr:dTDP-4-dehydrorhamnose reductase [Aureivirga sp. CE67]
MKILITGASGQLGNCLKELADSFKQFAFYFKSSKDLDITNIEDLERDFTENQYDYCINCAAYTAVDQAESDVENAEKVNVLGSKNLAEVSKKNKTVLIHISTDFVFDGNKNTPYVENDVTNPLGVYGKTKLEGELAIQNVLESYFILRTSWLYSEFGNNFMKSMIRLGTDRDELGIIYDQIGTPTYAMDLAKFILYLIQNKKQDFGVYHFSNLGAASWYDFAKAIFEYENIEVKVNVIRTEQYPTPAERPKFSVMDKNKILTTFDFQIPYWRESLKECLYKNKK